jgi:3-hydroxyacyl-CoA dehydrogenase
VRGEKTSDAVIKTSMALAKRIRKVAVLVGVCMGFVGNRILFMRQHEASRLALEGAPIEQVDKVLFDFGFPMGAFQMGDLAGLDLGWDKQNSNPTDVKDRLCDLGRYGQKTGAGYYDYDDKRRPTPAAVTAELFAEIAASQGIERGQISDEEILDRCLLPMVNEGAKILDEGIALRASDIDVVYVYGYGWPVYRGGPMHYANSLGLDKVLAKIRHYHETTGDDFWAPSPLLISLAEQGKSFK